MVVGKRRQPWNTIYPCLVFETQQLFVVSASPEGWNSREAVVQEKKLTFLRKGARGDRDHQNKMKGHYYSFQTRCYSFPRNAKFLIILNQLFEFRKIVQVDWG